MFSSVSLFSVLIMEIHVYVTISAINVKIIENILKGSFKVLEACNTELILTKKLKQFQGGLALVED